MPNDDWRNPFLGTTAALVVVMAIGVAAIGIGGITTLLTWVVR